MSIIPDFKLLFSNYLYKSSVSREFSNHFVEATTKYIKEFKLKKKSFIIDIGSNDGVGLLPFKNSGFTNLLGIEPASNLAKLSKKRGIKTINNFFSIKVQKKISKKADLILASNVFAHADNLKEMAVCMLNLLDDKGKIVIEVQYFPQMLNDLTFDNIYHEHVNYWSLTTLITFFSNLDCKIYKAEKIKTHGGSLRVYISKNKKIKLHKSIKSILLLEKKLDITNEETFKLFRNNIFQIKENFIKNINYLKMKYKKIVGYGAPAKATTALNFFSIKNDTISFIIDDNPLKVNKFVPGTGIKIRSINTIKKKQKCILVLAWNMFDEIRNNNQKISSNFFNIRDLYDKDFIKKFF